MSSSTADTVSTVRYLGDAGFELTHLGDVRVRRSGFRISSEEQELCFAGDPPRPFHGLALPLSLEVCAGGDGLLVAREGSRSPVHVINR